MCTPCVCACVTERDTHRAYYLSGYVSGFVFNVFTSGTALLLEHWKARSDLFLVQQVKHFLGSLTAVTKCNYLHFDLYIRRCKCRECGDVHAICMNDAFWLQCTDVICSKLVSGDQFISPQSVCLWLYILNRTAPVMQVNLKICFDVIYCPTVQSTAVKGHSTALFIMRSASQTVKTVV